MHQHHHHDGPRFQAVVVREPLCPTALEVQAGVRALIFLAMRVDLAPREER